MADFINTMFPSFGEANKQKGELDMKKIITLPATGLKNLIFAMLALSISSFAQADSGKEIVVNGKNLAEKLQWLQANAESNTQYSIVVSGNEKISSQTLSYAGKRRVTVRLSGTAGKEKIISLSSGGPLFTVEDYVTLILDKNIDLQGSCAVNSGGTFTMIGGKISGNRKIYGYSTNSGGGVSLGKDAKFTMTGGEISGNSVNGNGGGVSVGENATFTMTGGEISGNSAERNGGGVYVAGKFLMEGGKISGNAAYDENGNGAYGGGVYVDNGIFKMTGGEISGNIVNGNGGGGGGVSMPEYGDGGDFTMEGGVISGNKTSGCGGGVFAFRGKFNMIDGKISDNTAGVGGGVCGNFTMKGGLISSNKSERGGGIFTKVFMMENGIISNNTAFQSGGGIYGNSSSDYDGVTFNMVGGEISNNTVSSDSKGYGGGIYLSGTATFTMKNGKFYGNSVSGKSGGYGGGLCVGKGENNDYTKFVMEGGEISGNKVSDEGGGIYVNVVNEPSYGFKMNGGEIYGNKAIWAGGGVYVSSGNFSKSGGTIYGYAKGDDKGNRVKEVTSTNDKEGGHAVYINGNPVVRIDTTLNEDIAGAPDCDEERMKTVMLSRECAKIGKGNSDYSQCARNYTAQYKKFEQACRARQ